MFDSFFDPEENLKAEYEDLKIQRSRQEERIKLLSDENTWLREQLFELKRSKFGKKSERWESQEQGCLFNEAEVESKKPEGDETEDKTGDGVDGEAAAAPQTPVAGHTRKRGKRKPLPENLPREVVKIELPLEQQVAEDGTQLKVIGWEVSEKLKYEPSKMSVVQYQRAKYGVDSGDYVKTAPPVPSIIPKGIPTPELLAAVIVSKYADGLPLYRLEEIFKRQGIELSRGTMARWVIAVAEACRPIWNVLSDKWRESFYVACDETHVQVLKESGRKAESKSWMLVRSTPFGSKKIILFDYNPSRGSDAITELISGFEGYLQCDGLNSYDQIAKVDGIVRLGCNMHSRRRFESAEVNGAKAGKSFGTDGLQFYKELYDLEEEIREKTPDERFRIRNERAEPIWEKMLEWAKRNKPKVPQKSKIGGAFSYFLNEYEYLTGYLKDGRLEMDNGFTERAIRKFAIGRNNWMFSDTEDGADASALLYSLVVTAKVNGVNPYTALVKLFTALPLAETIEDFERLAEIILSPEAAI
jgi:transposase